LQRVARDIAASRFVTIALRAEAADLGPFSGTGKGEAIAKVNDVLIQRTADGH